MTYILRTFWDEAPPKEDIERHRAEYQKLSESIAQLEHCTDAASLTLIARYRRMRYNIQSNLTVLEKRNMKK